MEIKVDLIAVIEEDCKLYEKMCNENNYMYLHFCNNSKETGLYQLILNGCELYYGTLSEINAVVKSICNIKENLDGKFNISGFKFEL